MSDVLSQDEIDALLKGTPISDINLSDDNGENELSPQEIDALGEIGNICMGTSATTLFTLVGQKVTITTPKVSITTWEELSKDYTYPIVAVRVEYTHGLTGTNLLILKENDVKIITDLMMGGEGNPQEGELNELHLSAISEAMNQMIGSAATSMSALFNRKIEISPPKAFVMRFNDKGAYSEFDDTHKVVRVSFKMVVGNIIDSEIMQLLPIKFAKNLVDNLLAAELKNSYENVQDTRQKPSPAPQKQKADTKGPFSQQLQQANAQENAFHKKEHNYEANEYGLRQIESDQQKYKNPVNIQPAQFQQLEDERLIIEKKNISLIMDVPLEVTVELGRTHKYIKDILEFGLGSIIELDKLAGEPVDILVNGKPIAKGEVVVIDESFGVRITDILHPSKRL